MRRAAVLLAALVWATAASSVDVIGMLKGRSPADYIKLRETIRDILWEGSPPSGAPGISPLDGADAIVGRDVAKAQLLTFDLSKGIRSHVIYVQTERAGATCLFLYHAGHSQGFVIAPDDKYSNDPGFYPKGVRSLIAAVAAHGCDLLLFSMPLIGENRFDPPIPNMDHADFARFKPDRGSALRFFIDAIPLALDYTLAQRPYSKIAMAGLSGGGWTTVLAAAIEPRIQGSYSIAGTLPQFAREGTDKGDWEQTAALELWSRFDYVDLYLMGVAEPWRQSIHSWGTNDDCCFKAAKTATFTQKLATFAKTQAFGQLSFYVDDVDVHDATPGKRASILSSLFASEVIGSIGGDRVRSGR